MSKVSVIKCADYDSAKVEGAVFRAVELLGGIESFVGRGDSVLIKPNLLSARLPEDAVCTHPEIVRAAIRLVRKSEAKAVIGDSPGTFLGTDEIENVYEKTGVRNVAEEEGAELVKFNKSRMVGGYPIAEEALKATFILSLPKLKTHVFTVMTGAVKNTFGMVSGLFKSQCHRKSPQPKNFVKTLLDVYKIVTPGLSIMDGVVGMDGEGPSGGRPVNTGFVAASADGVSLDAIISKIVNVPEAKNVIVNEARRRGVGEADLNKIDLLGDSIEALEFGKFRLPVTASAINAMPGFMMDFMRGVLSFRPLIDEKICVKCGICKAACPVDAIAITKKESRINKNICIECFCCHEMCPHKAIRIEKGLLASLFWRK